MTGLSLALYEGWELALVVCAVMPILMCAGHYMGKEIEHFTALQHANFAQASAVAEESLMAIRTVAAFGGEAKEVARFERELLPAKVGGIRSGTKIGAAWGVLNFFYPSLYALALWFGGHVLMAEHDDGLEPSRIITVMISMMVGVSGLSAFSGFASVMAKAAVSAQAMKEVMALKAQNDIEGPLYAHAELPPELWEVDSIEFRKVSFKYPGRQRWVLNSLSFRVEKGQKVALVGESGSGKSTTIQLLERFYDPSAGEVLVNGVHLCQVPTKAWRKLLGYVGQEPVLFATTAMKNLKGLDNSISDEEAILAAKAAQIYDTLSELPDGMDTFVGAGGGLLSGGQKQRIAIARALAKNPQVLLLDEATSALDNESERLVQATIDSAHTLMGRNITTISVAHRLTTIMGSDTIYVLKDGSCCEQGNHEELMDMKGHYYNMAKLQQDSHGEEDQDEKDTPDSDWKSRDQGKRHGEEQDEKKAANAAESCEAHLETQMSDLSSAGRKAGTSQVWCRLLGMMGALGFLFGGWCAV